ncbi:MAG TPA: hypothetical protein DFR83_10505 [Deltaproteobacteria bacterium]|nr:hypothetical protein [Deltaproteobacteria bacterium]
MQQTSTTASVNVLERMADTLPETESELYQWSETGGGLRIESQAPPLPEPANSEMVTGVGIRARVPLVVAADASGTLPRASGAPPTARPGASARERGVRLAAVMQAAAAVEAFHPYHSRTVPNLDAAIVAALRTAAEQPGATAGLDRLASELRDGHAQVIHPDAARLRALPWEWTPLGEDLVITAVSPTGAGGVRPGDRVVRFGGEPIESAWARWAEVATGGSPGCRRLEGVKWAGALLGEPGRSVEVEVESLDGALRTVEVSYDTAPGGLRSIRLDPVAELSEGTLYVDLSRLDDRMWRDNLKRLTAAERLVVDLRDYPGRLSRDFLRHFSTETMVSDDFVLPIWGAAGEEVRRLSTAWRLAPKEPHISSKRVFLAGASSVSYAESILGVVQRASLGPIVGDTSCGSNGNLTRTHLIGGTLWGFTGLDTLGPDTLGPDGIHRNPAGIQPDRKVGPTREGIAESRDEVLEAALAVLEDGD